MAKAGFDDINYLLAKARANYESVKVLLLTSTPNFAIRYSLFLIHTRVVFNDEVYPYGTTEAKIP